MAKPKKKPTNSDRVDPPPEQLARNVYEWVDPAKIDSSEQRIGEARRNVTQTPLDRYLAEGKLGGDRDGRRLWEAGNTFRLHWYWSGMAVAGVSSYGENIRGDGHPAWLIPATHRAAHHRREFREAMKAVGGMSGSILFAVCCLERDVTRIGGDLGWAGNQRSAAGMASLRVALDVLASYYRI